MLRLLRPLQLPVRRPVVTWRKPSFRGGRGLRTKPGEMNGTEAAYAREVLEPAKQRGAILDFWFQEWTFKLADDSRFTPDFVVLPLDCVIEAHEINGSTSRKKKGEDGETKIVGTKPFVESDAKVKLRVLATRFPLRVVVAYQRRKYEGGGWGREDFTAWSDAGWVETTPAAVSPVPQRPSGLFS